MEKIKINSGIIRLGQFLKIAMMVETGGEAKTRVQTGEVLVNGEIETRRGCQLRHLDVIELDGISAQVIYPDMKKGE
jgi:ribosome-associated protein